MASTTRHGPEDGITSVEAALALPVVLALVMTLLQGGLWFAGREIAQGAATQGALAAAAKGAGPDDAQAAVNSFIGASGLRNVTVTTSMGATSVDVTVAGDVMPLVPGLSWSTSQRATVAREVFTTP